ncbi:MAG: sigma-70 family RNA polymerase sigma factor [Pirellulaceae bacterium]
MNETSLSLLQRVRHDSAAPDWRRFTELYEPLIRGWLRRKDCLGHDADDVVQNILAVIVRRLDDFEHNGRTGAFRAWLRTITVNCLRDHWRANRSRPVGAGGSDMQEMIAQLEDPESNLSRVWNEEHDRHVMRKLLEFLRDEFEPRTWQAFQRFALDDVPASDVAKELEMTPNAVFIAKSRVLARLRQESAGLLDE